MFTDISNRQISIDIYFSLYIAYHIFENCILNARVVINIDSCDILTRTVILSQRKTTPPVITNQKTVIPLKK